jgi:hypothetical protein
MFIYSKLDLYHTVRIDEEGKETLKESTKETYDVIVDVTKDFYETTKNKAENWYKNYKESRN